MPLILYVAALTQESKVATSAADASSLQETRQADGRNTILEGSLYGSRARRSAAMIGTVGMHAIKVVTQQLEDVSRKTATRKNRDYAAPMNRYSSG